MSNKVDPQGVLQVYGPSLKTASSEIPAWIRDSTQYKDVLAAVTAALRQPSDGYNRYELEQFLNNARYQRISLLFNAYSTALSAAEYPSFIQRDDDYVKDWMNSVWRDHGLSESDFVYLLNRLRMHAGEKRIALLHLQSPKDNAALVGEYQAVYANESFGTPSFVSNKVEYEVLEAWSKSPGNLPNPLMSYTINMLWMKAQNQRELDDRLGNDSLDFSVHTDPQTDDTTINSNTTVSQSTGGSQI